MKITVDIPDADLQVAMRLTRARTKKEAIVTAGVSVTNLAGSEGRVFARTFIHSIVLTVVVGLLVAAQQYLIPWIIPS